MFSQCPEAPALPVEIAHHLFNFFSAKDLWLSRIVCRQWKDFIEKDMVSDRVLVNISKYKSFFGVFYRQGYLLLHINMGSFFQNFPHEDKLTAPIAANFPFLKNFLSVEKSKKSLTFCSKDGINFYLVNPIPTCLNIYFKHPANNQIHKLSHKSQTLTLYEEMPFPIKSLKRMANPILPKQIAIYARLTQKAEDLLLRFILLGRIHFYLAINDDAKQHYPMPYVPKDCENKTTLRK